MNEENKSIVERLVKAIKANRFNYERYLGGRMWYGHRIDTMPLFCSYGQIGFTATIDNSTEISYDWELKRITMD